MIHPWRFSLPVIDLLDSFQCDTGFDLRPDAFGDGLEIRNLYESVLVVTQDIHCQLHLHVFLFFNSDIGCILVDIL